MAEANLEALLKLAKMVQDKDMARLAELQRTRDEAAQRERRFFENAQLENTQMLSDLSYRRDLEQGRRRWRYQESHALSHYTARSAALAEAQKTALRRSFGRAQALEKLVASRNLR